MKKLFSLILALCMVLTAVSSLAEGDFTGTWYMNMIGLCAGSFDINADGTFSVTVETNEGTQTREGTWKQDENAVILTYDEQDLPMTWDGESISLDMQALFDLAPDATGMNLSGLDASVISSLFQVSREPAKIKPADYVAYQADGTLPEGVTGEEMESVTNSVLGLMNMMMGSVSTDVSSEQVLADAIDVLEEAFVIHENYGTQGGTFLAKVKNKTEEPVYLSGVTMTLKDADGNEVGKSEYPSTLGSRYLEPGEETYLSITADINEGAAVAAHEISFEAYSITWQSPDTILEVTDPELRINTFGTYSVAGTVTNAGEANLGNLSATFAVRDAEGRLMDIVSAGLYGAEIPAGNSVILVNSLDYSLSEYYSENGIVPASVDALATVEAAY